MRPITICLAVSISILVAASAMALPQVALTRSTQGLTQLQGGNASSEDFVLTNVGDEVATVSVSPRGNFFTVSPTSFVMQPGTSRNVTVRSTTQQGGFMNGSVDVSVQGVQQQLSVPVRLFVGGQPNGSVQINAATQQTLVSGLPGQLHSGSIGFSNFGTAGMQGIGAADVPWIAPPNNVIGISSKSTGNVAISVDPSLRPDGIAPLGASVGNFSLVYITGTSQGNTAFQNNNQASARATVEVFDITKAALTPQQPSTLGTNELAMFIPNLFDLNGLFSDLFLSNRTTGGAINDLRLFYNAAGNTPASTLLANVGNLPSGMSAWFPVVVRQLFNVTGQAGSVQARSNNLSRLSMSALSGVFTNNQRYLTAMPVLRSDASVAAGDRLLFSGVEKSTAVRTDVILQETAGFAAAYTVDFFDGAGAPVAPNKTGTLQPFQFVTLPDALPAAAKSARVTNTSTTTARINGYASVIDEVTRDVWTVIDPSRAGAASGSELRIPLPDLTGAPTTTVDVYLTNGATSASSVTVSTNRGNAKRRAVKRSAALQTTTDESQTFSLAPLATRRITITDASLGYVRVIGPASMISATGRVTSTVTGRTGSFGTGVPALPLASASGTGTLKRFSRADELPNVSPATLLLLETSGRPATVRVTLRFNFPAGSTISGQLTASKNYDVAGGELFKIPTVTRTILGPQRDTLGRIFNVVIDAEVVGGDGKILPFLQTTDPSGDITIGVD